MDSINEDEQEPEHEPEEAKLVAEEELKGEDVLIIPTRPMTHSQTKQLNQAIGGLLRHIRKQTEYAHEKEINQTTLVLIQAK